MIEIDRYYPSSKRCFGCGTVHAALGCAKRWACPACGVSHDRDENAAKNIRAEGLRQLAAAASPATVRAGLKTWVPELMLENGVLPVLRAIV